MSGDPKPEGAFDRMRQTTRRKGPLSFADLSATIVDAQKKTGFVDTVSADIPPESASATFGASTLSVSTNPVAF